MIELKIPFHIDANAFRGSNNGFASPGNSIIDFEGNNRDVSYSANGGEKRTAVVVVGDPPCNVTRLGNRDSLPPSFLSPESVSPE